MTNLDLPTGCGALDWGPRLTHRHHGDHQPTISETVDRGSGAPRGNRRGQDYRPLPPSDPWSARARSRTFVQQRAAMGNGSVAWAKIATARDSLSGSPVQR